MSFTDSQENNNYIWLNGDFTRYDQGKISVLTHSLHYSGAVFEGIRSYKGNIFKLEKHIKRLFDSAADLYLPVNYSQAEVNKATKDLLIRNNLQYAYIRPLIWRGAESLGVYNENLSSNLMIMAIPSKPEFRNDLTLILGPWKKLHHETIPVQCKSSAHYATATSSKLWAKSKNYDDALFLDVFGDVAECTTANIFFGKDKELFTPIADRFLNGITRQTVIEMAGNIGLKVNEIRIKPSDLEKYDTCFVTGTSAEIRGVTAIDLIDKKLYFPNQEVIIKLQQEFAKIVGKE